MAEHHTHIQTGQKFMVFRIDTLTAYIYVQEKKKVSYKNKKKKSTYLKVQQHGFKKIIQALRQ